MNDGWVITKDHLFDPNDDLELPSRVGWGQVVEDQVYFDAETLFPRRITVDTGLRGIIVINNPVNFRLIDEDGIEHYSGVISENWLNGDEILAFAPLRFAENDTGATIMLYEQDGSWEHL